MAGGPVDQMIAQALMYLRLLGNPAVKTEMELKSLLPKGAQIIGLIPRIEIASDARRDRWLVVCACIICFILCVALITFIWEIHAIL